MTIDVLTTSCALRPRKFDAIARELAAVDEPRGVKVMVVAVVTRS